MKKRNDFPAISVLLANLSGKAKKVTGANGREYLVAPVTLIVPGVLNGSEGALYYPPEEIRKDYAAWNGMPIVVYHPIVEGRHVSARDPQILDNQGVGHLYQVTVSNGKLKGQAWFDCADTQRIDVRIYNALLSGTPFELSTGLFTEQDKTPGTFNGTKYDAIARNYKPDHLAVFVDQVGACSLNDGCGVLVNSSLVKRATKWLKSIKRTLLDKGLPAEMVNNMIPGQPKSKNTGKFKKLGSGTGKGDVHESAQLGHMILSDEDKAQGADAAEQLNETGNNPPSWVADESIWEKAKKAADKGGYEGSTYWAVVAHIYKNMGGTIESKSTSNQSSDDQTSNNGDTTMALTKEQRKVIVTLLTTNCDCWKDNPSESVEILNKMTDKKLLNLKTHHEKVKGLSVIADNVKKSTKNAGDSADEIGGVSMSDAATLFGVDVDITQDPVGFLKAMKSAVEDFLTKLSLDVEEDAQDQGADEATEGTMPAAATATGNRNIPVAQPVKAPKSTKEWMNSAPAEVQSLLRHSMGVVANETKKLIAQLTANCKTQQAKNAAINVYKTMPLEQLQALAAVAPQAIQQKDKSNNPLDDILGNAAAADYSGAGNIANGITYNEQDTDDVLPLPRYVPNPVKEGRRNKQA